jgi:hypothetical protein
LITAAEQKLQPFRYQTVVASLHRVDRWSVSGPPSPRWEDGDDDIAGGVGEANSQPAGVTIAD